MFSHREYSSEEQIHQLSEQVKLQVGAYGAMAEVYEKYSLALARIMEQLHQLHDDIKGNDDNVDGHLTEIITCIAVVGQSIKHAEEVIRIDNSVFVQRFNELVISMDRILDRVESTDSNITELRKFTQEFSELMKSTSFTTLSMVQDLHNQNQKQLDFWKRWRMWLYAFVGIIGILETMIQFGVLQLTWFK